MVIGNKGAKIKVIGTEARRDMEEMFEAKVHLELWGESEIRLGR
ncbi:GTP-binding protein Era [Pantoea agglomerans]|uniref:GTP-binding protein Era n=1 Tax=Enterobacter agglomerans TaxID=549 RepID=A0A379AC97_ENTAG|nr:GTP-binding protein Era [Pantoea agglomerans]